MSSSRYTSASADRGASRSVGGKTFYPNSSTTRSESRNSSHGGGGGGGGKSSSNRNYSDSRSSRKEGTEFSNYYRDRFGSHSPEEYRNLRLSHFDPKISNDELREILEKELSRHGELQVNVKVIRHQNEDQRLAYVNFVRNDIAKKVRKSCQQKLREMLGRHLKVDPAGVIRDQDGRFVQRTSGGTGQSGGPLSPPSRPRPRSPDYGNNRSSSYQSRPPVDRPKFVSKNDLEEFKMHEALEKDATRTLFLGNLPVDVKDTELKKIFDRYGPVEDIDIKTPHDANAAYAFVQYENLDQAIEAKYNEQERSIRSGGQRVKIGYGKPLKSCRLWIGGLGPWTSIESMSREFDRYGLIDKIDYMRGGNSAYITFASVDASADACQAMTGFPLGGKDRCIRVGFAKEHVAATRRSPRRSPSPAVPKRRRSRTPTEKPPTKSARKGPKTPPNSPPPENKTQQENGSGNKDSDITNENGLTTITANTVPELEGMRSPCWTGALVLKKSAYAIRLYKLTGDDDLVDSKLRDPNGESVKLHVTQRLPFAVGGASGGLAERFSNATKDQLAFLVAVANPNATAADLRLADSPSRPLKALIHYLGEKTAAGVVTLSAGAVLYAFPTCELALSLLKSVAPNLTILKNCPDNCLLIILSRSSAGKDANGANAGKNG